MRKEHSMAGGAITLGERVAFCPTNPPVMFVAVAHSPSRSAARAPLSAKSWVLAAAHASMRIQCVVLEV